MIPRQPLPMTIRPWLRPLAAPARLLPCLIGFVLAWDAVAAGPGPVLHLAQADGLRLPESRRMLPDDVQPAAFSAGPWQGQGAFSLGEQWSARWARAQSPGSAVFQSHSMSGQVDRALADGWGLGVGLRRNDYLRNATLALTISAEKQWGEVRGSYTLLSGLSDGHSAESHRLGLSYRHDQRNSWSLALSAGRDPDQFGALRGLSPAEVHNWSLGGQHRLSGALAVTYGLVSGTQGGQMPRSGLRLGLRHDF
jgi:YaiO family outer membrane protein